MGWEGGCPAHAGPGSAAERVETETRASPGRGLFYPRFYLLSIRAMQTSLIQNAHGDLVTDAAYDFYGVRLATCSLDHRIKVWQLDESDGNWTPVADWKVRVSP